MKAIKAEGFAVIGSGGTTAGKGECGHSGVGLGIIYWHRELPPFSAEVMGEHVVEATSKRVPGTIPHRGELWELCYKDLMIQARTRLLQEVVRLGGTCAHVLAESIGSRHDDATGATWLQGRFTYVLYRQPKNR